jgi:hypothetical protein
MSGSIESQAAENSSPDARNDHLSFTSCRFPSNKDPTLTGKQELQEEGQVEANGRCKIEGSTINLLRLVVSSSKNSPLGKHYDVKA